MAAGRGAARVSAVRAVLLVFLLGACAVTLAPAYDAALVARLNDANEKTLTLLAR